MIVNQTAATKAAKNVFKQIATEGLRAALHDRDAPFGDSRARVTEPEVRDENGYLVPLEAEATS